ncbi:AAA family ATPase [Mycobacteroides immunogenum]|uniref:AAA family ATPase n=1 Tax=Mycobacteroides immunogenum TaxID=83262 RepID=UPI0025B78306|nr:AAA family ATPase [Mycobacteroides immunogenum]WJR36111.1 AAA family ATPase [Mycobacteroides immunogenum]
MVEVTIEHDIRAWALTRPAWQQDVLVGLSRGETYDDPDAVANLADRLLMPDRAMPNNAARNLTLGAVEPRQVFLKTICNVKGVNALAVDQTLAFAPAGLTINYGNNGSGKSGYARIIKAMVSARHSSLVLPDVYRDGSLDPSAELEYSVDDQALSEKYPTDPPVPDLQRVRFYDEHCGDEYLSRDSSVTYRPSALTLLDGLIVVCGKVREELQRRVTESHQKSLNLALPQGSAANTFLSALTLSTSDQEIDDACTFTSEDADNLGKAIQEVARLETSDATKERARLHSDARHIETLKTQFAELEDALCASGLTAVRKLKDEAATKRSAATVAAATSFDDEPLAGVGSETWRTLWRAARDYAVSVPGHEHEFPEVSDDARCVLCQQPLGDDAKDRFTRFDTYMRDTTESDAVVAERLYGQALAALRSLDFTTHTTTTALSALLTHDEPLATAAQLRLSTLENHRNGALEHFTANGAAEVPPAATTVGVQLGELATSLTAKAEATDVAGFQTALTAAKSSRDALAASQILSANKAQIKAEVVRRRDLAKLDDAYSATDTKGITRKATDLTGIYATEQIRDHFTRETARMHLEKVTLRELGGQKGQVRQIPALVGVRHKDGTARAVLSEGEQTVLGLAGFFTEAEFDASKSAVVFDDPVTSLDHVRRDKVADRLAQLAKSRQVIVFTHDVAFLTDLLKSAGSAEVKVTARTIQRRGDVPGYVADGFPWKAQDIGQRLNTIHNEITKLTKDRQNLDDDEYEQCVNKIAGHLSETWERTVTSEIVNRVYDRSKSEVRPQMVRMLARITDEDNAEYQDGYGKTSKWALRHDKAEETNYVAPEPNELEAEYDRLKAWHKRIKSYQQ